MAEINERIAKLVNIKADGVKSRFASMIGVSDTSVRLWMEGRSPDANNVVKICQVFNVSSDWILFGEGPIDASQRSSEVQDELLRENTDLKKKLEELESKINILYNALDAVTKK